MMTPLLGRLERVDLRSVWGSESSDFTPWLAQTDNLVLLSNTIGIDLDLEMTEKNVGAFRADIVCKEALTGDWVLIENQLERTDHTHLGQLFTYAAGLRGRVTIVWIAERFTDEHRAALDWLNEVTTEDVSLFGIQIELWRIGDSPAAPNFKIVSQPNDWTKRTVPRAETPGVGTASENELLRLEFWTRFRDYLEEHNSFVRSQKPSVAYWTNYAIGRTGFSLAAMVGMRDGYIGVNLTISHELSANFFELLQLQRADIEQEIGATLDWRENPQGKFRFVELFRRDVDPTNRDNWPEYFAWLRKYIELFHRTFSSRVKQLNVEAGEE